MVPSSNRALIRSPLQIRNFGVKDLKLPSLMGCTLMFQVGIFGYELPKELQEIEFNIMPLINKVIDIVKAIDWGAIIRAIVNFAKDAWQGLKDAATWSVAPLCLCFFCSSASCLYRTLSPESMFFPCASSIPSSHFTCFCAQDCRQGYEGLELRQEQVHADRL